MRLVCLMTFQVDRNADTKKEAWWASEKWPVGPGWPSLTGQLDADHVKQWSERHDRPGIIGCQRYDGFGRSYEPRLPCP